MTSGIMRSMIKLATLAARAVPVLAAAALIAAPADAALKEGATAPTFVAKGAMAGKPITFEQFVAAARGGSFSKDIDTEAKKAVFRVNDPSALHRSAAKAPALNVTRGQPLPATELSTLAGERWTPVGKDGRYTLLSFYFDACGFTPTNAGLVRLR